MKNLDLHSIKKHISEKWKKEYIAFITEENINILHKNLKYILENGKVFTLPKPHFKEEVTEAALKKLNLKKIKITEQSIAKFIEKEKFENVLLLSGQRLTSASKRDKQAIPPSKKKILESCFAPYNNQVSYAVRAWEKHVGRTANSFWGEIKGNAQNKEQQVKQLITHCIENKTWWNVFFHYKHQLVYEIRISNGQGIRWTQDGEKLIGFLEPFL